MVSFAKAIRRKCLDCCCGQAAEVRRCPVRTCALWEFRFGKGPETARRRWPERFQDPQEHLETAPTGAFPDADDEGGTNTPGKVSACVNRPHEAASCP